MGFAPGGDAEQVAVGVVGHSGNVRERNTLHEKIVNLVEI
jgi:hypothetical protein